MGLLIGEIGNRLFLDFFLVFFIGTAVVFDVKERRIPNWLILFALTVGIATGLWTGTTQLWGSLLGAGLGIAALMIPFALGALGAGDVKFLGAIGAVLGAQALPRVLFYTAISGGIMALISIGYKREIDIRVFKAVWTDFKLLILSRGAVAPAFVNDSSLKGSRTLPYGLAIGLGTLAARYLDPKGQWAGF
jgi:prepilin peptidase CpaA